MPLVGVGMETDVGRESVGKVGVESVGREIDGLRVDTPGKVATG